ncbi:hypothetical protein CPter91_0293 [Collimonas pratensis]|uniref:Uncharacterized protein n=1 Tax=Collimonas pratensis TaxID=279113 RepID=A0A127PZ89_9BURK|nr:hypothetical protein CPter91_0293 [Collimonas pratensis]
MFIFGNMKCDCFASKNIEPPASLGFRAIPLLTPQQKKISVCM